MRILKLIGCAAVIGAAFLVATPSAMAGSVTAELVSVSGASFNLSVKNSAGLFTDSGGGGLFHWDGSALATGGAGGANNTPGYGGAFTSFCTDIKDFVSIGGLATYNPAPTDIALAPILNGTGQTFNTDLAGGMGTVRASLLSLLYGQHYADAITTADKSSAFQLAIWEIVYEPVATSLATVNLSNYNVTSFNGPGGLGFKASGGDTTLANTWLQNLNLQGAGLSLAALSSTTYQDQIVVVPPPQAVFAGLALGVSCLVWRRLRRNSELLI